MGEDNLRAAKNLLDQRRLRSCVSRAYFSAFSILTHKLSLIFDEFSQGRPGPSHRKLLKLTAHNLKVGNKRVHGKIQEAIHELQKARIAADYHPELTLDESVARKSVQQAGFIIEQMKKMGN